MKTFKLTLKLNEKKMKMEMENFVEEENNNLPNSITYETEDPSLLQQKKKKL